MEVRLAKEAGFCFGVTRAVKIARNTAQEKNQVYSLGPLIHNPQVVEKLARAGIKETENMADIPAGSTVIVPTHGVGPEVMVKLDELKVCVVDATCPFVRRAQNLAHYLGQRTQVVIVGDQKHPEVRGIIGYAGEQALIVEGPDQAELLDTFPEVAVLAQTTQPLSNFQSVIDVLRSKTGSVKVFNTICNATGMRQQAALELARQVGAMVVAGGKTSANTRRLAELSRESGAPTHHVETARDLKAEWFKGIEVAGLTAGASTPDWIIEEVQTRMKELGEVMVEDEKNEKSNVNALEAEEVKTAVPEEAVDVSGSPGATPVCADETVQDSDSTDEPDTVSEEGMEDTVEVKSLSPGQIVKGVVVQVGADEVLVDMGSKSEGVVPFRELSAYEAASPQDVVSLGDEIEVTVVKVEDDEGRLILSKARADAEKAWVDLQAHLDDGSPVEGVVREVIKGGLLVDVGLRAFMPASLVEQGYVEDLNKYVGVNVKSRVIELNRARRKVILSRKSVLEEERALLKQSVLESLEEGQTVRGIVRRLTNFGAFVDIGGVDGLLHISEMAWYRVNHPSDVLNVGDEIEVRILQLDRENEKISLSLKQVLPDPWKQVVENYPVGSIVEAKVVRLAPFGAFVQLEPGVEGLVHISHLADHHVESTGEIVHEGEEISVKVLSVEPEEKRIRLSIREAKREAQKPKNTLPETKEENVTIGEVVGDIFENN
ncbi:MAG TPA: bifunctional 4-hydroxy-3-methylbut-2-enyl diphosphate reductase/30S ribosomal protein S1 [Desulfotomaculum sp.]|nr:bifunctional 4-hydroxy-3-methylbut-2-enyl diphosphate reductase/30S ribosomal protein S1 [Desulfotomaculum sp.]HBY03896.1 bifunctional 4-hydroxy-3-methylbut-2-enyl diphosphate reductase/30S ribosomal protein S1 [Desulfotomaculum sp.]